jgi:hypothetical protein
VQLVSVIIRSTTRLRLQFSAIVDSTAFTGTGTITIVSQDGAGVSPSINQRIPVASVPQAIELALSDELVDGGLYLLTISSIPSTDLTTATGTELFRPGVKFTTVDAEVETPDIEKALFGIDLVWTGSDYLETPDGDLASVSGKANVHDALIRRLISEGLTWDDNYGVKPRQSVDGPTAATPFLRGKIIRQMLADDRVSKASVRLELPENNVDEADYFVDITLIGSSNESDFSITASSE